MQQCGFSDSDRAGSRAEMDAWTNECTHSMHNEMHGHMHRTYENTNKHALKHKEYAQTDAFVHAQNIQKHTHACIQAQIVSTNKCMCTCTECKQTHTSMHYSTHSMQKERHACMHRTYDHTLVIKHGQTPTHKHLHRQKPITYMCMN